MNKKVNLHRVSIVIPNYNGVDLIRENLASVVKAVRNRKNRICEVIVVDDASTDGSVSLLEDKYSQVKIIKHRINRGFSSSVNTGARSARGTILCLLNNDVSPSRDFLVYVLPHFRDQSVFGVSLHERGYGWAKASFAGGYIVHEPGVESRKTMDTFWVSGGSGVYRRDYWMKLRGMDEKLFKFYWEDVDLSYRAAKRGMKLFWEPKARVVHEHESTTSRRFSKRKMRRMQERNQLIFIWKNLTSPILFRKHIFGLLKRMSRHPGYLLIFLSAIRKLRLILKARKKEVKEGKVSDEALFSRF